MKETYFPFGERELSWLCNRDSQLGNVISRMDKPKRRLLPDLFSGLVFYILSQQISARAAETEWARFQKLFSPVVPGISAGGQQRRWAAGEGSCISEEEVSHGQDTDPKGA